MPVFNQLFDEWAANYDETVYGNNNEYIEVFANYNNILETISQKIEDKKDGHILEIGTGTGNLTRLLYQKNFHVTGIEPSQEMRKIFKSKLPNVEILDGHFLSVPVKNKVDAIVTSYAFHHLTWEEKKAALIYLDSILNEKGRMIIADTMFESLAYKSNLLKYVASMKSFKLLNDLNTEYYECVEDICQLFKEQNYSFETIKMNKYVWIISAEKGGF
ncbi:class I SAM-dependent methyltransferase [Crassaminicella thermophila]|uniref:Class I SAM-dependent methyltransferase n=1 Tax=Crassaminicella thermophila TaxID=2599308 RepID=A0A5C0SJE4_CRATE|nr:class I SAM-dependent methyltransferase [Crassaminicella thermophila]QEK13348.1 class I SAM-dependent methyltransferase [Crassaminicella thermophila]